MRIAASRTTGKKVTFMFENPATRLMQQGYV
jgi:hypothetical protein